MPSNYKQHFINYLLNIGIINNSTLEQFKTMLSSSYSPTPPLKTALHDFLFTLKQHQLSSLADNLYTSYLTNGNYIRTLKLRLLITLINTKSFYIHKLKQYTSFHKWKAFPKTKTNRTYKMKPSRSTSSLFLPCLSSLKTTPTPLSSSFLSRQNKHLMKRAQTCKSIITEQEQTLQSICTFQPTISPYPLSKTAPTSPVHKRLYEDYKTRKTNNTKMQNEYDNTIKNNANRSSLNAISKSKIEQLYKEYKVKQLYKKNLTVVTDNKNGFTYQPFVPHDKYYNRINTSFHEREQQAIEDKAQLIKYNEDNFRKKILLSQVGYDRWKDVDKEELKENVIMRLYGNGSTKKKEYITVSTMENHNTTFQKSKYSANTTTIDC